MNREWKKIEPILLLLAISSVSSISNGQNVLRDEYFDPLSMQEPATQLSPLKVDLIQFVGSVELAAGTCEQTYFAPRCSGGASNLETKISCEISQSCRNALAATENNETENCAKIESFPSTRASFVGDWGLFQPSDQRVPEGLNITLPTDGLCSEPFNLTAEGHFFLVENLSQNLQKDVVIANRPPRSYGDWQSVVPDFGQLFR